MIVNAVKFLDLTIDIAMIRNCEIGKSKLNCTFTKCVESGAPSNENRECVWVSQSAVYIKTSADWQFAFSIAQILSFVHSYRKFFM